ncbi:MAG: short-chain dehydrogenase [Phycisphaeraceae bacterium]|nr:MAG: short-chain dehydrogenase [Phycisphaeraceae bacterium]
MDTSLAGRIAVVTGASAGIGRSIAADIARRGGSAVVNARREAPLHKLAETVNAELGREALITLAGDAAQLTTIHRLMDRAKDHFGHQADLVVVNAGRGLAGSIMTSDMAQWEDMVQTNLLGAARLMREAGERMVASAAAETWPGKPRDIVVLGSNVGRHISPFSSMYGATKFAVNSLAEAQRRELGPKGVRVSLIEPGIVKTEFQAVAGYDEKSFGELMEKFAPVLEPDDIARTIAFICAQPAGVHLCDVMIRGTRQDYP